MRCVSVVLPWWFRVVAVPGSIRLSFFFGLKLSLYIIIITARTAQSYPRAVLMQRLSTRSAKRQKVIHARSTLTSLSYYIVLTYYAVEAEIFNTAYFAYLFF